MSNRFALAVHTLALLAIEADRPITSTYLARRARTNPVVIRRVLGPLRRAGVVSTQSGVGGGSTLARRPEKITLLDIYRAVGKEELFSLGSREQNPSTRGRQIGPVLKNVFCKAESAMEDIFADITLAQIVSEARQNETRGATSL